MKATSDLSQIRFNKNKLQPRELSTRSRTPFFKSTFSSVSAACCAFNDPLRVNLRNHIARLKVNRSRR